MRKQYWLWTLRTATKYLGSQSALQNQAEEALLRTAVLKGNFCERQSSTETAVGGMRS